MRSPSPDVADRALGQMALVGRGAELERIDVVLESGRASASGLLLHGREGVGKTVLWLEAVRRARERGYRVLECALSRNESTLAFAGLADLVSPVLDEVLPRLAPPQARALETALAIVSSDGAGPDERAVAFGLHGALSVLARDQPIALAIDDIQWLDPSSTLMLSYAIRRLRREPVLLVLARRDGEETNGRASLVDGPGPPIEQIQLGPMQLGAIHRLIRIRLDAALTRPQVLGIHAASNGNALHALELARAIHAGGSAGPDALKTLLGNRVAALPERTQRALTFAAVATDSDIDILSSAFGSDLSSELGPAIDADLVTISAGRLLFRHPLISSVAEASASDARRRELHVLLAGAATSPDARVAHLAKASPAPSADVARTAEDAARATRSRGARATSAQLFEAAARLTPPTDLVDSARRRLAAAECWYDAGDVVVAERILGGLLDELEIGNQRVEAAWLLGTIRDENGRWQEATTLWQTVLSETDDPSLTARLQCSLAITAFYTRSVQDATIWAAAAVASAERSTDPTHLARALAVQALTLAMSGATGHGPLLDRALALEAESGQFLGDWSPSAVAAECARHAGDAEGSRRHYTTVLERAVNVGDANVEQWAAFGLGSAELLVGDYRRAAELADVVLDIADQTGQMRIPARTLRAHVDAHLGHLDDARRMIREATASATAADEATHLFSALIVVAMIEVCDGDLAAAARSYAVSRRIATDIGLAHATALRSFLNEAEVAAAVGDIDQAAAALAAFDGAVSGAAPSWSDSMFRRARASILAAQGDLNAARVELEEALSFQGVLRLDRGRALLALGGLSRRLREHVRARDELGRALEVFTELGTGPWIELARSELARIPGRKATGRDQLTDAEMRIAELVAAGRSNREVATALVLSVKTVEVTLTRIYQKTRVRSRVELANRFGATPKH